MATKPVASTRIGVRLSPQIRRALEQIARRKGVPISAVIRDAIRSNLKKQPR